MSKILSDAEIDARVYPTSRPALVEVAISHKILRAALADRDRTISRQQGIIDGQALRIEDYEKRLSPIKTEG